LGCRSNLYEGEALAGELVSRGAVVGDSPEGCRAAVVVSCSVTATADKKCRQAVRRARREFEKNEKDGGRGVVAVCGCWAQTLSAGEARVLGIDVLVGNRLKHLLPDALEDALSGGSGFIDMRRDVGTDGTWDSLSLSRPVLRTRAFLKVQEGCDHFCSYCVIPFLRGRPSSRPLEDTLEEARRVVGAGCREIVLTGIHLGAWRGGSGTTEGDAAALGTLVRRMSALPGLARLRLGSLEPFALDEDLLDALAESPVFCRHLHLPLQSGDDEVLERMGRGYTADDFARVCERAREKLGEDLHISSDILVAFPGESERAFRGTLSLMERSGLGRVHVFPYSPRQGTLAARFSGRVPPGVASERVKIAMALGARFLDRYASRFVGTRLFVLAENVKETSHFTGYSRNFVAAAVRGAAGAGQEVEVRITDCADGELRGERWE
jgi:threonylcarbamoyladenosine tRNA methylthiotransferase MtaB